MVPLIEELFQTILAGIATACIYGLVALGFVSGVRFRYLGIDWWPLFGDLPLWRGN